MILTGFPFAVALAGSVVLAGLLFALQRLRVRRQVVRVSTAMFWRMAVAATPARVLHERFRHILGYVLVLAIALALWIASAGPRLAGETGSRADVFYLDASAGMTAKGVFNAASRALIADAGAVPANRRSVRLGDPYGTLLLAPGEDLALLPARLAKVNASIFPSAFANWSSREFSAPATVHYYGLAAGWNAARLHPGRNAALVAGYLAPRVERNRGIVALGASPAASGAWDKADVLIETMAAQAAAPGADQIAFTLGGEAFVPQLTQVRPGQFLIRDIPANGSELSVYLRGSDGFAADDRAALRLPERHRIRVAILPGAPDAVRDVVAAAPAFAITDAAHAQVVVSGDGRPVAQGRPALVFGTAQAGSQAFQFIVPNAGTDRAADRRALADALDQLGLARFDAAALASALGRPIGVEMIPGRGRQIVVWRDLFAADNGFARSPAMPLFVSQALQWLASPEPWVPYARAGGQFVDLDGNLLEAPAIADRRLGGALLLPQAGKVETSIPPVVIALTDRATTLAVAEAPPDIDPSPIEAGLPLDLPFLGLLFLAGILLAAEWVLFQRGWMP